MYKRDYAFRMNVMEEIFERSCIEILATANDVEVDTTDEYIVQLEPEGDTTKIIHLGENTKTMV